MTIQRYIRTFTLAVLLITAILLIGPGSPPPVLSAPDNQAGTGDDQAMPFDPQAADPNLLGFITSPSPTCTNPVRNTGSCYINWYYVAVNTTDSAYISRLFIKINGKAVARYQGFFQQSMYIPGAMHGRGFWVSCGLPGAGGDPEWGNVYSYEIRAYDSGGYTSANHGSVMCPADTVYVYIPSVRR